MAGKTDLKKAKSTKELTEDMKVVSDNNLMLTLKVKNLEILIDNLTKRLDESESQVKELKSMCDVKIKCGSCDESFKTKSCLKSNLKEKHKIKNDCKLCDEQFNKNWELEVHLKSHTEALKHICETCSKEFLH